MGDFFANGIPGPTGATGPAGPVTGVTGTAPIVSSGGAAPVLSISPATGAAPGSMSAADKTKIDGLSATPVNSVAVSAPITTTGGQTPTLGITVATPGVTGALSGTDKTRLDSLINPAVNVTYVFSETDLPAAVANVVTLLSNRVYLLMANVTLTAGHRIEMPSSSAFEGFLYGVSSITGNVAAPLVTITGGTPGHGYVRSVQLRNTNTAAGSETLRISDVTAEFSVLTSVLLGSLVTLNVLNADHIVVLDSHIDPQLAGGKAISLAVCNVFTVDTTHINVTGLGAQGIGITAVATANYFSVARTTFTFDLTSQVGISLDPSASIVQAVVQEVIREGSASPINSGWDQGTPRWRVKAVTGLPDSSAIGATYVGTPGYTVLINTISTYTLLAPATGTPWVLESDSERFSLNSAVDGGIKYTGVVPRRFLLLGATVLNKGGGQVNAQLALFVNGTIHPGSTSSNGVVNNRLNPCATSPTIVLLNPNDVVDMRITNETNLEDYIVAAASISVISGLVG